MGEEKTIRKLKKALIEMLRGYTEYNYYGKLEYFLKTGENAVNVLRKHEIIEELTKNEVKNLTVTEEEKKRRWYRLKPRGVDLAISMINLEHSERVKKYTKTIKTLTWIIGGITFLNLIFIIFF